MNLLAMQQAAPELLDLSSGSMDLLGGWLICFFTLAVFSFLYRDNPFYKIAEHVFVGVGTAYFALKYYEEGILEPLYDHISRALRQLDAPDGVFQLGGFAVDPALAIGLRSIAIVLGLMLLVRLVVPTFWGSRWPLAVMVGVYAALKMTGETQSKFVLQLKGVMKPLADPGTVDWASDWQQIEETRAFSIFANTVLLLGLVCALAHFIFTYRRTRFLSGVSRVGVVVLMITFGSMFGFTVLGRIALLIERVSQLADYNEPRYALGGLEAAAGQAVLFSPPILLGALMVLLLVLWRLQGGGRKVSRGG